jgi:hypothetical protein
MSQIASLEEIRIRFGASTPRRQFLFRQLQMVVSQLLATGSVNQIYLFGSFVTGKVSPNDIDLFVVMKAGFSTAHLGGRTLDIFQHDVCRIRYHADIFWATEAVGTDQIEDLLDVFSRDREGRHQPIFEVKR